MKLVRIVVAGVLFFLMFGLPALVGVQFLAGSRPGGGAQPPGLLAALGGALRRLLGTAPTAKRIGPKSGAQGAGAAGQGAPSAGPDPAGPGPDGQAAAAAGYGADGPSIGYGRAAAPLPEEFSEGGGPIDEIRAAQAHAAAYGTGSASPRGDPGWRTSQGGQAAGTRRPMTAVRGGAAGSSNEPWAKGEGGAAKARLELNEPLETPGGQQLTNAGVQGSQAVNMASKLHLLDGAKDHAGKAFDGNWMIRKGIPLEKYQDTFGQQAIGVKGQSGQSSVDLH